MEIEPPTVPFGKYKGQPITTLLEDTNYLEWCKKQEWFKNFPIVYNICVNQTIVNQTENSKTPEHNKMQNLFLEKENQKKFIDVLFNTKSIINKIQNGLIHKDFNKYFEEYDGEVGEMCLKNMFSNYKIEFEAKYNWDVFLTIEVRKPFSLKYKKEYWKKGWNILEKYFTDIFNINKYYFTVSKYESKYESDGNTDVCLDYDSFIYIEIKPLLGDDYPNVLRKMKQQKNLTSCNKDILSHHHHYKKIYILLVKDFASSTTTKEQLIEIFQQSNIKVIFLKDIIENDNTKIQEYTNEDNINELKEKIIKLEQENKMLKEKIKHYENN
jgi:hypothetical protein